MGRQGNGTVGSWEGQLRSPAKLAGARGKEPLTPRVAPSAADEHVMVVESRTDPVRSTYRRMRTARAAAGSFVFFLLAPGVVAGLIPWWLTGWQMREPLPMWTPLRVAGVILLVAGTVVLVQAFVCFVVEGVTRGSRARSMNPRPVLPRTSQR
jgi:hypothetical protein